jgi:hypothetical protein
MTQLKSFMMYAFMLGQKKLKGDMKMLCQRSLGMLKKYSGPQSQKAHSIKTKTYAILFLGV